MTPRDHRAVSRRGFLRGGVAGGALFAAGSASTAAPGLMAVPAARRKPHLVSPGCRRTKVQVARIYMGRPHGLWPKPQLDLQKELGFYRAEFAKLKDELADVDFVVDELVTSAEELGPLKERLQNVDGILAIHVNMGIRPILNALLEVNKPTVIFARPYSGHEWVGFGALQKGTGGAKLECVLTRDTTELARVIKPFRAIHHLREAKILDVTTRSFDAYAGDVKGKFGTEIKRIGAERVLDACKSIDDATAKAEADRWIKGATKIVEPSKRDIFKSCKLALAFEKLLDEEDATVMTADCYGSMYGPLCRSYAYPCIGFTRLNNMGLGGICESDLRSAMTHIIFQALTGRPGFISDPTVDESRNSIILAHCLGTTKMDGPDGPAAPYKLRSIMERQEGVVAQVAMRRGQKVTQAILIGTDSMPYFTGKIIDVPVALADDRGCRTKITVKVDGDVTKLWKNWSDGLHRQTCYGDITKELQSFCKFKDVHLVNQAV